MNRITAALLAALEAVIAASVGLGIALVPLTILWAAHYDLAIDWIVFWRASADIWLLGNGVDLRVTLDATLVDTLGLGGAASAFAVTIAPLGFALIAVLFGVRAGSRGAAMGYRSIAVGVSIALYGIIAILVTMSAAHPAAAPSLVQGVVLPVLVYGCGVLVGARVGSVGRGVERAAPGERVGLAAPSERVGSGDRAGLLAVPAELLERIPPLAQALLRAGVVGGTAAVASIVAVASVLVAVLLFFNYSTIIQLYEGAQADILGGITLTLAQLAFIPNLVIWAASWLIGPGFSIGTGSAITPLGTELGPIPALPMLGALPPGELSFGFLGLLAPVLAGFLAGVMMRPVVVRGLSGMTSARWLMLGGAAIGVFGGIAMGLLTWWSGGAAGPGRLVDVGPDPWLVGAFAALELGVAAAVGMLVGSRRAMPGRMTDAAEPLSLDSSTIPGSGTNRG